MNDESLGPFRRDGRMRFISETRDDDAALRALRAGATLELPGYLFVLSLGPAAFALAAGSPWLLTISALLILLAFQMHRSFAAAKKNFTPVGPRRTCIAEDGIFIDGVLGPAKYAWDTVTDVRVAGAHVVVQFASREVMALRVAGAEAERLVAFIRERSELRLTDSPGRLLLLLAVLYVTCVAAAVVLLP